jgi:hypothetical protein
MTETATNIAQQHLSRLAEILLTENDEEAIASAVVGLLQSGGLRKRIGLIVRDYCSDHLRPEIHKFAGLMEMKLRKHDPARGQSWKSGPTNNLERIEAIVEELKVAVEEGRSVGIKAADLANHAMMLADRAGELADV